MNISYPLIGAQKCLEIEDENKLRAFYDKRISHEVAGESLGDEFKGYIFKISGGNDKQGFPMKQGVLTAGRVKVLLRAGVSCYRPRRDGERKRRSVRGCIVSSELSVLNLVIVKKGDAEIDGLTTDAAKKERRLGPKRAPKIRKLFNLSKEDDVRQAAIRRTLLKDGKPKLKKDGKTPVTKAPRIQRLVTPARLQHKRQIAAERRRRIEATRADAVQFNELVQKRFKEAREARAKLHAKRRSLSRKVSEKSAPAAAAKS